MGGCIQTPSLTAEENDDNSKVKEVVPEIRPEDLDAADHVISSKSFSVEHSSQDGQSLWSLGAESSSLVMMDDNSVRVFLDGVEGEVFEEGTSGSRFTAATGQVNQETNALELTGGVEMYSDFHKVRLLANSIEYVEEEGLIKAFGQVKIEGESFGFGPSSVLYATPGLTWFGTKIKDEG